MPHRALLFVLLSCSAATALDAGPAPSHDVAADVVAQHNRVRAAATPMPNPPLPALTWNEAAASVASSWAANCRFTHNPAVGGLGLGENLYASTGTPTPTEVVSSWAAERTSYDLAANSCSGTCGHYTQLVWRPTTSVGCGWASCAANSPFGNGRWTLWVCDYSPAGNVNSARPY
jgi:pathogenesis-related protein 1